ncbi:polysaccharide biosynthesis tyrosine autokinase [Shewanella sp. 5_MG-2023]|uniref:polysaccharide biosynthesis tyrosine autokinase n=1 Tax=Shewanella sp. 5_MG-2023 TaxID=3062656 RepID=UPI0026E44239|nr:polysaccharide biosynthesis tyrosine autokinase [Shewanella sp. 5_MG-2023]MDO6639196.1 polysaccharide biosynthesis tyrosine autokinase [Shewanella sp. 5_MG-2023]
MAVLENKATTDSTDEIDLGKLFGMLIDSRWLIITITGLFAVIGVVYALLATPIYKADSLLQIEQKSNGMSALGEMGDMFAQESSATIEIEIITSRMILGSTVDALNLQTVVSPSYLLFFGKGLARMMGEKNNITVSRFDVPKLYDGQSFTLVVTNDNAGEYILVDENENKLLNGKVGVEAQAKGISLYVSSLESQDGFEFNIGKRSRLEAIQWVQENLSISEKGKQTGILQLSFSGEDSVLIENVLNDITNNYFLQNVARNSAQAENSLVFLKKHLPQVKTQLTDYENTLNSYRQQNDSIDLGLEAKSVLEVMVALEAQLNELTFKESEVSQRFTKDHPAYIALLQKRDTLLSERERLNKQVQKLPKTQREVLRMSRDVEVNQQIYVQLLNKVQELNIVKASTVGNVRILDNAQAYPRPIKPKKPLIAVLATMLGAMLSVGFVLVRAAFHRGVDSPEQIEALGIPVYANIPKSESQVKFDLRRKRTKVVNGKDVLLAESHPEDLAIEALRALRTSLHFAMMDAKNNIVMVTGPAPAIGKSFVSANLAAVVANTNKKVLVIDGDMRKGYMQRHFGLECESGLSDILSGQLTIQEVIKHTSTTNLDLITRGSVPPNPSELLTHSNFKTMIEWASENYDYVIIDTPPILAVTDPGIVGRYAGTSLMVGCFEKTTAKEVEISMRRFEQAGIEIKGFILNMVEKKASSTYGYGYYNYSYQSDKK